MPSSDKNLPPILDLSSVKCPINFAKIKVRLAKMNIGDRLKIILGDPKSIGQIPNSLELDGQRLLSIEDLGEKGSIIEIEKRT